MIQKNGLLKWAIRAKVVNEAISCVQTRSSLVFCQVDVTYFSFWKYEITKCQASAFRSLFLNLHELDNWFRYWISFTFLGFEFDGEKLILFSKNQITHTENITQLKLERSALAILSIIQSTNEITFHNKLKYDLARLGHRNHLRCSYHHFHYSW